MPYDPYADVAPTDAAGLDARLTRALVALQQTGDAGALDLTAVGRYRADRSLGVERFALLLTTRIPEASPGRGDETLTVRCAPDFDSAVAYAHGLYRESADDPTADAIAPGVLDLGVLPPVFVPLHFRIEVEAGLRHVVSLPHTADHLLMYGGYETTLRSALAQMQATDAHGCAGLDLSQLGSYPIAGTDVLADRSVRRFALLGIPTATHLLPDTLDVTSADSLSDLMQVVTERREDSGATVATLPFILDLGATPVRILPFEVRVHTRLLEAEDLVPAVPDRVPRAAHRDAQAPGPLDVGRAP